MKERSFACSVIARVDTRVSLVIPQGVLRCKLLFGVLPMASNRRSCFFFKVSFLLTSCCACPNIIKFNLYRPNIPYNHFLIFFLVLNLQHVKYVTILRELFIINKSHTSKISLPNCKKKPSRFWFKIYLKGLGHT